MSADETLAQKYPVFALVSRCVTSFGEKGSIPAQEKAFKPVSGGFGKDSAFEPCRVAAQK